MTDRNYTTSFVVDNPPEAVLAAVVNPRAWWSDAIEGPTDQIGATWRYHFRDIHRAEFRTTELTAGRVVWHVLDNHFNFTSDTTEWVDTHIVFDIVRTAGRTELRFTHVGLVPEYECYEICENAWGTYVGSLRSLITTGTGFPNVGEPMTTDEAALSA